ncbi:putative F-box domain-containing protein [Medicago truncatula]|uniref:Cyclin-like F-box; F-box protein interaction domain; Galactose oxidase, central n=1 Tax=Medicago truncatula TaxID=3880 RepID=Q2HVF5_MEDTR|nr:F-box protein CPR1 [Medicago truncatula]ABD28492.1 Cyclin-like F-box; F-box protein interaction domain; Galactose oxidase, central [Medicago truncatula]AES64439.1 F-box and associated interaction domain protein [Medicago truncatula]RHN72606.1 putative F-box domain-containing protein [Medicago truncatula]
MAADVLPPEILAEIFSRLPVQSLLRFRSTSKSLKSLIDSHNFTNLYLKNNPLNRFIILRHKSDLYQLQVDDDDFSKSMIPLNHPLSTNIMLSLFSLKGNRTFPLIGSCNGLLALSDGEIVFKHPHGVLETTIWNPNTRKDRTIPFIPLPIPNIEDSDNPNRGGICVHGFGFDPFTADYKLLRITWLFARQNIFYDSHVSLFSLKTNSWKTIPSMPYALQYVQAMGVFVQNSLHWVMAKKLDGSYPWLIVAFNLTLEIFNEVPLPVELEGEEVNSNSNGSFKIRVAVLGGCLCMSVNYEATKIDVWVMKDYGSRDSWCKLFTLVKSCFNSPLDFLRPLCYSSDGGKVLLEANPNLDKTLRKLFWYDLKSEQVSYVEGIPNFDEAMFYVGSLVSPFFPVDTCKKENRTSKTKRRDDFLSRGFKLKL